ncbi:MAG TPA: hypothetical protein VNN07_14270 [Candidatus Tectomicrobia bacterium]|nr:hypothetical protein [Candidatus Tectomicrobia bacterium]
MNARVGSRRLVLVWAVLGVLLVAIVVLEHTALGRHRPGRGAPLDARLLLPVPVAELGAVEIARAGTLHRFERDAAGAWFYHGAHGRTEGPHTHATDPAVAARIEHALQGFGRARMERLVGRADLGAYGLATPAIVILVYRRNESQPLQQYAVGETAPDTVSRYVDVVGGPGIVTIPSYHVDNLVALLDAVARGATATPDATARPPGASR